MFCSLVLLIKTINTLCYLYMQLYFIYFSRNMSTKKIKWLRLRWLRQRLAEAEMETSHTSKNQLWVGDTGKLWLINSWILLMEANPIQKRKNVTDSPCFTAKQLTLGLMEGRKIHIHPQIPHSRRWISKCYIHSDLQHDLEFDPAINKFYKTVDAFGLYIQFIDMSAITLFICMINTTGRCMNTDFWWSALSCRHLKMSLKSLVKAFGYPQWKF